MEEDILQRIGLTKGESKVYQTLLKLGSSTTGPIVDSSGVARSKVYSILQRLMHKGLVTTFIERKTKRFKAADPKRLLTFLQEKQEFIEQNKKDVQKAIPYFESLRDVESNETAEIYHGLEGVKTARELVLSKLKKGDTFYVLGANRTNQVALNAYWKDFHKRRKAKGIKAKYIIQSDSRDSMGKEKPYSEGKKMLIDVKFFDLPGPVHIDIFGDFVVTCILQGSFTSFLIKNKHVAQYYRDYFDKVWKAAKK